MRQFAAQERQAEKEKMTEWKDKVMLEMTHELNILRRTHEEVMEAQRQSFQIELERVGGKLEQLEVRSRTLENEVRVLRSSGQLVRQDVGKCTPAMEKNQARSKEKEKSLENSASPLGEEAHQVQNPRIENNTPLPQSSPPKNTPDEIMHR